MGKKKERKKFEQALADPEQVTIGIMGRNGFMVLYEFEIKEDEMAVPIVHLQDDEIGERSFGIEVEVTKR